MVVEDEKAELNNENVNNDANNDVNNSSQTAEQGVQNNEQASDDDDSNDYFKAIEIDDELEFEELNEEVAFNFLKKSKGLEVEKFEDLLTPKEVNPYEDVFDDEDRAYLNFKKETGRSRKDFEALNSNLDELPKIELARERVRRETGLNLSNEQIDEYIAEQLDIDLDDISASGQIKLAAYTKAILEEKKAEQEKYRTPIENKKAPETKEENTQKQEYVELPNGAFMTKEKYDSLLNSREQSIIKAKEAVNSVTVSDFKITVNDKGTPKEMNFAYEYSDEDRQSMVSFMSDIDGAINSEYGSGENFDHKKFAENMQWANKNFREKAIASLLHKVLAINTEEVLKERGNVNFANESLPKQAIEGVKIVSMQDAIKGNI